MRNLLIHLVRIPCVWWFSSLIVFKSLSIFQQLDYSLGVFEFIPSGVCWTSWMVVFKYFIKFQPLFRPICSPHAPLPLVRPGRPPWEGFWVAFILPWLWGCLSLSFLSTRPLNLTAVRTFPQILICSFKQWPQAKIQTHPTQPRCGHGRQAWEHLLDSAPPHIPSPSRSHPGAVFLPGKLDLWRSQVSNFLPVMFWAPSPCFGYPHFSAPLPAYCLRVPLLLPLSLATPTQLSQSHTLKT